MSFLLGELLPLGGQLPLVDPIGRALNIVS